MGKDGGLEYNQVMLIKELKEILERAETWPEEAKEKLIAVFEEIDAKIGREKKHG